MKVQIPKFNFHLCAQRAQHVLHVSTGETLAWSQNLTHRILEVNNASSTTTWLAGHSSPRSHKTLVWHPGLGLRAVGYKIHLASESIVLPCASSPPSLARSYGAAAALP